MVKKKEDVIKEGEDNLIDEHVKKTATRNTLIIIGSLIAIFALIFGVNFLYEKTYRNPYQYEYNDFQFQIGEDNKWYTQLQYGNRQLTIPFTFGPRDIQDIPITGKVDERFIESRDVYITFDPAGDVLLPTGSVVKERLGYVALAASELSLNLVQGINVNPIPACTYNDSSCDTIPIVTCEDGEATIYLKQAADPGVHLDGNCIILSGTNEDIVKSVDRLLMYWYRIMP